MTNRTDATDTDYLDAYARLAEVSSNHIRITQAIARGKMDTARTVLTERMGRLFQDRVDGDDLEDMNAPLDLINNDFGPRILNRIAQAAQDRIELMSTDDPYFG